MKIKTYSGLSYFFKNERGVSAVFVSITLFMFLAFTALAVDFGHLYGVRNELQNAADAAALAGAYYLIQDDEYIKTTVKADAEEAGEKNPTGNVQVEIDQDDVLVGHWSFAAEPETAFIENNNTKQVDDWKSRTLYGGTDPLDSDEDFINAVKVTARRADTPSFLARIFGEKYDVFSLTAVAVAYTGFSASAAPHTVDLPFGICNQFITLPDGTAIDCSVGTAVNDVEETGGWTGFDQARGEDDPECGDDRDSTNFLKSLLDAAADAGHPCSGVNPGEIDFGDKISTDNGNKAPVREAIMSDCVGTDSSLPFNERMTTPLNVTLPVMDCLSGYKAGCTQTVIKTVNVDIVWMTNENLSDEDYPKKMTATVDGVEKEFECPHETNYPGYTKEECWAAFADEFRLLDRNGDPIGDLEKFTLYFIPNCEPHEPAGESGNVNTGIPAIIPVLVYPVTS